MYDNYGLALDTQSSKGMYQYLQKSAHLDGQIPWDSRTHPCAEFFFWLYWVHPMVKKGFFSEKNPKIGAPWVRLGPLTFIDWSTQAKCLWWSVPMNDSNIILVLLRMSCNVKMYCRGGILPKVSASITAFSCFLAFLAWLMMTQDMLCHLIVLL